MERKFAYIFSLGDKVVWSGDTKEQLLKRTTLTENDRYLLEGNPSWLDLCDKGALMELDFAIIVRIQ